MKAARETRQRYGDCSPALAGGGGGGRDQRAAFPRLGPALPRPAWQRITGGPPSPFHPPPTRENHHKEGEDRQKKKKEKQHNDSGDSRAGGLLGTDLSIMMEASPIQGIRWRPCSCFSAFSSSRNSLQA